MTHIYLLREQRYARAFRHVQYVDNMHQEKKRLKEKLSKQKFHVQYKYNLGLIQQ